MYPYRMLLYHLPACPGNGAFTEKPGPFSPSHSKNVSFSRRFPAPFAAARHRLGQMRERNGSHLWRFDFSWEPTPARALSPSIPSSSGRRAGISSRSRAAPAAARPPASAPWPRGWGTCGNGSPAPPTPIPWMGPSPPPPSCWTGRRPTCRSRSSPGRGRNIWRSPARWTPPGWRSNGPLCWRSAPPPRTTMPGPMPSWPPPSGCAPPADPGWKRPSPPRSLPAGGRVSSAGRCQRPKGPASSACGFWRG